MDRNRKSFPLLATWQVSIVFFAILIGNCADSAENGIYAVIAPKLLLTNQEYKVILQCEKTDQPIKVSLTFESPDMQVDAIQSLKQEVQVQPGEQKEVSFQIPDLPDTAYDLVASTTVGDQTYVDVARLTWKTVNEETLILLLQTDRPVYKVGQTVQFRGLVLGRDSRPSNEKEASFYLTDANLQEIKQWQNVSLDAYGHFKGDFVLAPSSPLGFYQLKMSAGQIQRKTSFQVIEHERARVLVNVEVPLYFLLQTSDIPVVINAHYDHGGPVKGIANITMEVIKENFQATQSAAHSQAITEDIWDDFEQEDKLKIEEPINGQLKINLNPVRQLSLDKADLMGKFVEIKVTIIESENCKNVTKTIRTHPTSDSVSMNLFAKTGYYLEPGLNFHAGVHLSNFFGQPIHDSQNVVQIGYRFMLISHDQSLNVSALTRISALPTKGFISLDIPVPDNAQELLLKAMYKRQAYNLPNIKKSPLSTSQDALKVQFVPISYADMFGTFLQVDVAGDRPEIEAKVQTNRPISRLNYLIVARNQPVHQGQASGELSNLKEIRAPFLASMRLGFQLIVYVYDESKDLWVSESTFFTPQQEHFPSLHLSSNTTSTITNKGVTFTVQGRPNSLVVLSAIDNEMTKANERHKISDELLGREFAAADTKNLFDLLAMHEFNRLGLLFVSNDIRQEQYYCSGGWLVRGKSNMPANDCVAPARETHNSFYGDERLARMSLEHALFETWLWEAKISDPITGLAKFESITPEMSALWSITAFSVNQDEGLAFTKLPIQVQVTNPLSIDLHVPLSIVIGEIVSLRVTLHNQLDKPILVKLTLLNSLNEYDFVERDSQNALVTAEGETSQQKQVTTAADEITLVNFIIKPRKVGEILLHLQVETQDTSLNKELKKVFRVSNKGQSHFSNKIVLLNLNDENPNSQLDIDVNMPDDAVQGSRLVTLQATNDIIGFASNALDHLSKQETAEDILARASLSVTILRHLEGKELNQVHSRIREQALDSLQQSYQQLLTLQRVEGGFVYLHMIDSEGSTWLTSQVLRLFLRSNGLISIDNVLLQKSVKFLLSRKLDNGSFQENDWFAQQKFIRMLETKPGTETFPALDAHVLVSLHQASQRTLTSMDELKLTVSSLEKLAAIYRTTEEIRSTHSYNFYSAAIITYALHQVQSPQAALAFDRLWDYRQEEADFVYFGRETKDGVTYAPEIEATAYALETLTLLRNDQTALPLFRWLLSKQNSFGMFVSNRNTAKAWEAIVLFSSRLFKIGTEVHINYELEKGPSAGATSQIQKEFDLNSADGWTLGRVQICERETDLSQLKNIKVTANGRGTVLSHISWQWNSEQEHKNARLSLAVQTETICKRRHVVRLCAASLQEKDPSDTVILQMHTPSGFVVDPEVVAKLSHPSAFIQWIHVDDTKTEVTFHINQLDKNEICLSVPVERSIPVADLSPAVVTLKPMFNSEKEVTAFYSLESVGAADLCTGQDICLIHRQ